MTDVASSLALRAAGVARWLAPVPHSPRRPRTSMRASRRRCAHTACRACRSRSSRTASRCWPRAMACASSARPSAWTPTRSSRPVRPARRSPAAALAVLVDDGKLRWDDKVIDHMPWFRMYDPWVTREMTVRDLLVHRSGLGLGAGDLMFVPALVAQPRRHRARAALHQARDQLPQRLRVRQRAVRRRRPADRGGQRPDAGKCSCASACSSPPA